jgi:hypothetical protein
MVDDVFYSAPDYTMGKVLKYRRPNPLGEDIYLGPDGKTITKDEDKIISAQRIFKHNYYKPGGRGAVKVLERYSKRMRAENLPPEQERNTSSSVPGLGV